MQRKLIKQGGGGYTIYLPKKWVDGARLTAGDEVIVEETDGALLIVPREQRREEKRIALTFTDEDWTGEQPHKYVQRMLATAYKQGATVIDIKCRSRTILNYIERRVSDFIGLEITEQAPGRIIVRSLAASRESEFENGFSRAIQLTRHIAKETASALKTYEKNQIETTLRLERTHNKITDFIKRILASKSTTSKDDLYVYAFTLEIERLIDEYKYLLQGAQKPLPARSHELLADLNKALETLLKLITRIDVSAARAVCIENAVLRARARKIMVRHPHGSHLLSIAVKIYELGETVLEWKLDSPADL